MRVSQLEGQLGVEGKVIRKFLRERYGLAHARHWDLSQEQVEEVCFHFSGRTPRGQTSSTVIPSYARREHREELVPLVESLRRQPQDIIIQVEGGESLVFHKVMRSWRSGRGRERGALLSNGQFITSQDRGTPGGHLLELQYCFIQRPHGDRLQYKAYAVTYIERLSHIRIPLRLLGPLIDEYSSQALDDTPQEVLIDSFSQKIDKVIVDPSIVLDCELKGVQLKDLTLQGILNGAKEARPPRYGYSSRDPSRVGIAINRYLATANLLEDPEETGALKITLGEVYQRFGAAVEGKADNLRDEVAGRLGFTEGSDGWIKRKQLHSVFIGKDLKVHIDGKFVCVVSRKSTNLPYGDEVARRMLMVATEYRNEISTITLVQREALRLLFQET